MPLLPTAPSPVRSPRTLLPDLLMATVTLLESIRPRAVCAPKIQPDYEVLWSNAVPCPPPRFPQDKDRNF